MHVDPAGCAGGDCYSLFVDAVSICKKKTAEGGSCAVVLAPGFYPVRCPPSSNGAYVYPLGAPGAAAVDLSNTTNVTFGGAAPAPSYSSTSAPGAAVRIAVDYVNGGCPAIAAMHASNLVVQHVELDTIRLPFSSVTVMRASETSVSFLVDE